MKLSVIIPNYNGKKFLEKNLPGLMTELTNISESEVIVVDDGSSDDSVEFLERSYTHDIKVISLTGNSGFATACNQGIAWATGRYILLMNNDVLIESPVLNKLLENVSDEIFAVTPKIELDTSSGAEEGFTMIDFSDGDLKIDMPNMDRVNYYISEPVMIPHAVAAFAIYDREKLIRLGKFNELFSPYFWEDVDLSYRALEAGYKIIHDPRVKVYHQKSKTVKKYYKFRKRFIVNLRNRLWCTWIHLDSETTFVKHFLYLTYLQEKARYTDDRKVLIGLRMAFDILEKIKSIRKNSKKKVPFYSIIEEYHQSRYEKYFNNSSAV